MFTVDTLRAAFEVVRVHLMLREESHGWGVLEYIPDGDVWMWCQRGLPFPEALALYTDECFDRAVRLAVRHKGDDHVH